jgi:hypothetical protein
MLPAKESGVVAHTPVRPATTARLACPRPRAPRRCRGRRTDCCQCGSRRCRHCHRCRTCVVDVIAVTGVKRVGGLAAKRGWTAGTAVTAHAGVADRGGVPGLHRHRFIFIAGVGVSCGVAHVAADGLRGELRAPVRARYFLLHLRCERVVLSDRSRRDGTSALLQRRGNAQLWRPS